MRASGPQPAVREETAAGADIDTRLQMDWGDIGSAQRQRDHRRRAPVGVAGSRRPGAVVDGSVVVVVDVVRDVVVVGVVVVAAAANGVRAPHVPSRCRAPY